jgi:hypothetical protein
VFRCFNFAFKIKYYKIGINLDIKTYISIRKKELIMTGMWYQLGKLSLDWHCCMLSSGWLTSICSLNANVLEHCLFHLHRQVGMKMEQTMLMMSTIINDPHLGNAKPSTVKLYLVHIHAQTSLYQINSKQIHSYAIKKTSLLTFYVTPTCFNS